MGNIQKKIGFVSLGCDKNRVDLEKIIFNFIENGYKITPEDQAEIIVINTCAFLESAREEAVKTILEVASYKKTKCLKYLIVTGCLPNCEDVNLLKKLLPEVDAFVKIQEQKNIVEIVDKLIGIKQVLHPYCQNQRFYSQLGSTAYLKICDGCNNWCSYCKIPAIRGKFVSTKPEEILEEAKNLAREGIKEIVVIGQDITNYGSDLTPKTTLASLLKKLCKIDGIEWIRLLYCYPEKISDELIKTMQENKKICHYIDIPMQHVCDDILKSMHRRASKQSLVETINKLRIAMPDIAIRTTFIVGYPGETCKHFKELEEFVKAQKLNYAGVFAFSKEEGTKAYNLPNQVCKFKKRFREKRLTKTIKNVSFESYKRHLNKTYKVICNDKICDELYSFRSQYQAPEIDPLIYAKSISELTIGEFYEVTITNVDGGLIKGEIK